MPANVDEQKWRTVLPAELPAFPMAHWQVTQRCFLRSQADPGLNSRGNIAGGLVNNSLPHNNDASTAI